MNHINFILDCPIKLGHDGGEELNNFTTSVIVGTTSVIVGLDPTIQNQRPNTLSRIIRHRPSYTGFRLTFRFRSTGRNDELLDSL